MLRIVPATEADLPLVLRFIGKLAEYEKLSHQVTASEETLRDSLFRRRVAETLLAYWGDEPAGFAVFFHNFSTFIGKPGIWLEDLFVEPHLRGKGIGKSLLMELVRLARERDCGRVEWSVLDWNQPAIDFYRSMGADVLPDWRICRVVL